jgi:dCMP deaminase
VSPLVQVVDSSKFRVPVRRLRELSPRKNADRTPDAGGRRTQRPRLELLWVKMATDMAMSSTCPEGKRHGAIVVVSGQVAAIGYNGPPAGWDPCAVCTLHSDELGKDWRTCPAVHAEQNAILSAAKRGVSLAGGRIFLTKDPCQMCRLLIENSGIVEIVVP